MKEHRNVMIVWRAALVVVALLLGWRILASGLGEYYGSGQGDSKPRNPGAALAWNPAQRTALAQLAGEEAEGPPRQSYALWSRLLRADPTSSAALFGLAQGGPQAQDANLLVDNAVKLNPSDPATLKRAAAYWLQRGDLSAAMTAWSRAMIASPVETQAFYPILLQLLEDPRTQALLVPYIQQPPPWWDGFFRHVALTATDIETVRTLYGLRRTQSGVPLDPQERGHYVARLRREGRDTEAYLTWVNGLDEHQRKTLGLINNGSFESAPVPDGWDWQFTPHRNLVVELSPTYGADGQRALHIVFRGFDQVFQNVSQDLFLEPGRYRLSGTVRPNGLKTTGGLQWVVECTQAGQQTRQGETERFLGSSQWTAFQFEFDLPQACEQPVLRLVSAARVSTDRRIDGSIWFDALRVQRLGASPAP